MPDKDGSMFAIVERHGVKLEQHEDILDDHAMQLRVQSEQIKQLQDNGMRLENVVMKENSETRLTITNTNAQLHDLIKGLMGYKTGQSQLTNTLALAKLESWVKIIGVVAGSGGFLYWIFN